MAIRFLLTVLLFTTLCINSIAQINKEHIIKYSLIFLSGASDGIHECLWYHYDSFKRVHPNANDDYWNPYISSNQINNGNLWNRTYGRAFSDGNHLTRFFDRNLLLASGVVVVLGNGKQWYKYAIDFVIGLACRTAGFHLTYSLIYD